MYQLFMDRLGDRTSSCSELTNHPPPSVCMSQYTCMPDVKPGGFTVYTPDCVLPAFLTSSQSLGSAAANEIKNNDKGYIFL